MIYNSIIKAVGRDCMISLLRAIIPYLAGYNDSSVVSLILATNIPTSNILLVFHSFLMGTVCAVIIYVGTDTSVVTTKWAH